MDDWQRELIFRPVAEEWSGYSASILGEEQFWIPVGDKGERIQAWWVKAKDVPSKSAPTILFFHGARVNLSGSVYRIRDMRRAGYNVLAIDYRGFGRSSPRVPSEESVYEDAEAAWDWFVKRVPEPQRRVLYGHSLGGAVAAELAARRGEAAALVLESTFTSVEEVASRGAAGILPLSALLNTRFDVRAKISKVAIPVLILHGGRDDFTPPEMAKELYALAREPKRLLMIENAGHRWVARRAGEALPEALRQMIAPRELSAPR
jgi:pimeloyl-ACP methyl ester carboxylesterase